MPVSAFAAAIDTLFADPNNATDAIYRAAVARGADVEPGDAAVGERAVCLAAARLRTRLTAGC